MPIEIPLPIREPLLGDLLLNEDQRAVMLRELRDMSFGIGHLYSQLQKGESVPLDLAKNILYLNVSRNEQICKLTGIEIEDAKEREDRYARMRLLNERIRELETELGTNGSVEQTIEHIKVASSNLEKWWDVEGFAHISDIRFTKWGGVQVDFSCTLFGDFSLTQSKTPVSDKERKKQWYASLKERGFRLGEEPGERDPVLIDCDQNREALLNLFGQAMPSARITETTNHYNSRAKFPVLRSIKVYIQDLNDIVALQQRLPAQD